MKRNKVIIANIISAVLLAGCSTGTDINDVIDETNNTNISTSTLVNHQESTTMNNQNTAPSENSQTTVSYTDKVTQTTSSAVSVSSSSEQTTKIENNQNTAPSEDSQTSVSYTDKTTQTTSSAVSVSSSSEQTTKIEEVTTSSTEIYDCELPSEIVQSDTANLYSEKITKFTDKYSGKKFIILNVTPNRIYWNEFDGYSVTEGQTIDIPIPAIFEDWVSDADEIMIYLSSDFGTFGDLSLDNGKKIKGMTYPQNWAKDYLCPIKDGIVCFGEYTDNINNSFSRVWDGPYILEANYYYSDEPPFENNMSVSDLDIYFERLKSDSDQLKKDIEENPDVQADIAGFWGYQEDGIRFRATINNIY